LNAVRLYHSSDGGTTFQGPIERAFLGYGLGAENSNTMLSDGTFAAFFAVTKPGRTQGIPDNERQMPPNAALYVVTSTNGGDSLNVPVKIADWRMDRPRSEGAVLGQLGSDLSNGPFKDRMYAVYTENVDDRLQIRLSYSADKGRTWSTPRTMNDEPKPANTGSGGGSGSTATRGPDHILPAVAVNNAGVVLVTWYDRREFPDGSGWRIRAAASLDGGETWMPSVPVSDRPHSLAQAKIDAYVPDGPISAGRGGLPITFSANTDNFLVAAGHTTGLVADASGLFYPIWVDNRTGIAQLWTAPVRVNGTAMKNGRADLAQLEDVSSRVALDFAESHYDGSNGSFTATVCLKNVSRDTVRAPFKGLLTSVNSAVGTAQALGAENGVGGAGAVWNFTSLVPSGVLLPDSTSATTQLRFVVNDRHALTDGRAGGGRGGVFSASVRLLAQAPPLKPDTTAVEAGGRGGRGGGRGATPASSCKR
jgi:hypothetical protein